MALVQWNLWSLWNQYPKILRTVCNSVLDYMRISTRSDQSLPMYSLRLITWWFEHSYESDSICILIIINFLKFNTRGAKVNSTNWSIQQEIKTKIWWTNCPALDYCSGRKHVVSLAVGHTYYSSNLGLYLTTSCYLEKLKSLWRLSYVTTTKNILYKAWNKQH